MLLTYEPFQCFCYLRYRFDLEESMLRHSEDEEVTSMRMKLGNGCLVLVIRFYQLQAYRCARKESISASARYPEIVNNYTNAPADVACASSNGI